ncbi:MAG: response regulator [Candidatus Omnitrophota bacterium]
MSEKKILVVEDEIDSREAIGHFLEKNGFQVFLAKDGEEAFRIANEVIPDIIITDIIMPNVDGTQLIKKIQETHFGKKIRIIVVTVRKNLHDYFEMMGVDCFIIKPFRPEQILEAIEKIVHQPSDVRDHQKTARRVLVAGSHNACLEKIVEHLKKEGCHTDFVTSGNQVISKAVMFLPEVILLETEIYDLSSSELVSILRQMPQFKKVPIVIYSRPKEHHVFKQKEDEAIKVMVSAERCLEKGATAYLGNYDEKLFTEKISRYISLGSVVLIDDDEGITRLIKSKVESSGYKVFAAKDGLSGLELVRKLNPSLVLLDVVMPGIEGYEVLDMIRHDPSLREIPVIMVTIKGKDDEVRRGLSLGADDYVVKPFCMSLLIKKIKSFIPAF